MQIIRLLILALFIDKAFYSMLCMLFWISKSISLYFISNLVKSATPPSLPAEQPFLLYDILEYQLLF